ncbi:actin, putative [Perkinsus marinus ATCC 50983]|uniref:Actin, putative n=1 Tax=Perkinsus marinus (strain ATCC 50983 / TXsc) TaxID=423536 RepID=C5M1P5_PERM5|nr:actin, putative [Perkinsus marinus ATCC 50983]EEQ97098.1 actin, putative [Perkinsus marinus ATCC 50983]|eukprot:XP_002764381.1 actin, putative [Perkinsus marinus ATCC 50983]
METTAFSDLECKFDETDVIVMDTGSGLTKVGYSGYDVPVRVIPTVAFQAEFTRESSFDDSLILETTSGSRASTAETKDAKLYGEDAIHAFVESGGQQASAGERQIIRPVQRGEIIDKDHLEAFWEYTLRQIMRPSKRKLDGAVSLEEFPVLMADTPSSTAVATASNDQLVGVGGNSYTRAWMAEVMFEKFNVPAFAVMNTAALSLFSTGMPTGLAVDIGEGYPL